MNAQINHAPITSQEVQLAVLNFAGRHNVERMVLVHGLAQLVGLLALQMEREGDLISFEDRAAAFIDQARVAYEDQKRRMLVVPR